MSRNEDKPDYYEKYINKTCRLNCGMFGSNNNCQEVFVEEGSLVEVVLGDYLDDSADTDDDHFRFTVIVLTGRGKRPKNWISCDGVPFDMLEPEPGIIDWSREDSIAAVAQGWDIFHCDGSEGPLWQLCRIDEDARFQSDLGAQRFVWNLAVEQDNTLCKRALAFLYYRSPDEYADIRRYCLDLKSVLRSQDSMP